MRNFTISTFFNQLTAMPKRLAMVLTVLFTLGVGSMWGETATYIWDLTSSSADWTSFSCETYFSQPYGMKKVNVYIINKSIDDFENYAATATSIQIGVKSLCNGATTSKLTVYLVDKDGNTIGSGQVITPDNKSSASSTTYKYVTFTSNLATATGYKIQCTTYGKNVLVNGSSYEITYVDSSSGGGSDDTGGDDGSNGCTWKLVTDASTLKADDEVIITSGETDAIKDKYALSTNQKTSNREAVEVTKNGNTLTDLSADVQVLTLKAGSSIGTWAFHTGTSGYLYAASSSGNQLKTKTTLDVHGSWTISISNGVASIVATGSSNRNVMQYNYNNGTPLFSCYSSASQTALALYRYVCESNTPTTCTVTFDANGHGTAPDSQTVNSGEYAQEPDDDPEETGYSFDGWFDDEDCTGNPFDFPNTPITDDITLYAKWTAIKYNITYKDQNNATFSGTHENGYPTQHTYGTTTTLKKATKSYYEFQGWFTASDCSGTAITQLGETDYTNAITLYAKWTPITYKITYNAGSGTCTTSSVTGTYSTGVTLPTSSPSVECASEGWTFAGWATTSVSPTTTAPTLYQTGSTYKPTADVELHAVYVKNTFILSLEHNSTTYYVGGYDSDKDILKAETNRNNAVEFQIDDNYLRCESGYISHNSTSSTNISCFESKDKVFPWTITETNGTIVFQSTKAEGNARYLGFNYNSGNPRFAAYVDTYVHDLTKTTISTYDSNPDCCSTIAPTNGAYNTDSDTEVILTWEDANNYGRYHITGGNLAAEGVYSENKNYTVSGLTKCQSYTFQVTAYPTDGCESPAITIHATPYKVKTVTFIDGSNTTTQYTSCEAESVTVPTASKDCYTSVWKDQDGKEYNFGATITPTKDLTLTAHYNIITYTIQFVDEDGTTILQSSTVDCGTTPSYTGSTPTKDSDEIYEYEFAGWSPTIVAANADATYTATYNKTKRTYKVQWYVNGVQYGTDQTVTAGETVTAPAIAEVPCGAVIAGWTDAEGGNYVHASTLHLGATPSIEIRSNKIFYAVFADYEE